MIDGRHLFMGDCPDDNNGPFSRDMNCPVCVALVIVEKHLESVLTNADADLEGIEQRGFDIMPGKRDFDAAGKTRTEIKDVLNMYEQIL